MKIRRIIRGLSIFTGALASLTAEISAAEKTETFWRLLASGWQINLLLGALFFTALLLTIRLRLVTRQNRVLPETLNRQLLDDLANGDFTRAQNAAAAGNSLFGEIALAGLRLPAHSRERISAAMSGAGRRRLGRLRQTINYLAHIGTLSPILGLLGTVIGLTKVFDAMGADGAIGTRNLMMTAYIGEAMGTTLVGLTVGIFAMTAYYLLLSRYHRLGDEIEAVAGNLAIVIAESIVNSPDNVPPTANQ